MVKILFSKLSSCFERKNSELLHILHSDIKLDLNCACADNSGDFTSFVFVKKFSRGNILSWLASQHTQEVREVRAANWCENMDIARVAAWLGWDICHAIATNNISAQKVS